MVRDLQSADPSVLFGELIAAGRRIEISPGERGESEGRKTKEQREHATGLGAQSRGEGQE